MTTRKRIPPLQDDSFNAVPTLSGTSFESLLTSFGSRAFFKPSPPEPDGPFRWRSDIVAGSGISVWRTQYDANWSYSSEAKLEALGLGFLTTGVADMVIGSREAQRTPSTVAFMSPATLRHHRIRTVDGNYASVFVLFEAKIVAKVLTSIFDGPAALSTLDLTPTIDLSTGTGQALHQLARGIVSGMHQRQLLSRSPKAMALLAEAILLLIFENVPHRLSDRLDRQIPDVTSRHIQRAIGYMRANLHLPLTVIDIAEAIGVGRRSLQLGFRNFRDTTPAAYLRRIRLDAVHAELLSSENRLPVHEVALKWGFVHMGRFAAQYREEFGIYPSETAKRVLASR